MEKYQKAVWISWFLLFFLFAQGVDYELTGISELSISNNQYLVLFLSFCLLLSYVIPITVSALFLSVRWNLSVFYFLICLLIGAFVTGQPAAYGNEFLGNGLKQLFSSSETLSSWLDALTAPIIEEGIKGFCAVMLWLLVGKKDIKSALLIGIAVGLGFQIMEDVSYITEKAAADFSQIIPEAVNRITGSISSHWSYTGLFTLGAAGVLSKQLRSRSSYFYFFFPIILHFIWNSPINELPYISSLLTALTLIILLQLYLKLQKMEY
ncbi:PrsW family glutamic-type intramembrane protease [Enterococcus sp. LJL128]